MLYAYDFLWMRGTKITFQLKPTCLLNRLVPSCLVDKNYKMASHAVAVKTFHFRFRS